MSYVDLDDDICTNNFDILTNDTSERYKILYVTKHRRFGVLNRIEAHVPTETPYLYTYLDECSSDEYDMDSEYLCRGETRKTEKIMNHIMETKTDLYNRCYTPVYVRPKTTMNYNYYYKIYSTAKNRKVPLIISKSLSNVWSITNKEHNRFYMDVVFNYGFRRTVDCPDNINIYTPRYTSGDINWSTISPYKLFTLKSNSIVPYRNVQSRYNRTLDSYVLKFTVGTTGIPSEKNSCIIRTDEPDDSKPYIEMLRISKDIISIIYRSPFTFLHAFTYGVARIHSGANKFI